MTPDELADAYRKHHIGLSATEGPQTIASVGERLYTIARSEGAIILPLFHSRLRERMPWAYNTRPGVADPAKTLRTMLEEAVQGRTHLKRIQLVEAGVETFGCTPLIKLTYHDDDGAHRLQANSPVLYTDQRLLRQTIRELLTVKR